MDPTQSFKDCINLGDLDRDQHPELAGLIKKYEKKLDPDELRELAVRFHSRTDLLNPPPSIYRTNSVGKKKTSAQRQELVNMIDAYRFERRCQVEDHDNFVERMIMFEQCGQDIQLEPGPLPGTFRSDVNHGQLFRFFGSVTEIRTHNHSVRLPTLPPPPLPPVFLYFFFAKLSSSQDTDRVLVELDVYIPWDLWRQGIDIRGGDKFELVRTFRSLRQDEFTCMGL